MKLPLTCTDTQKIYDDNGWLVFDAYNNAPANEIVTAVNERPALLARIAELEAALNALEDATFELLDKTRIVPNEAMAQAINDARALLDGGK